MQWNGKNFLIIIPTWCSTIGNKNIGKILKYLDAQGAKIRLYCSPTERDNAFKTFLPEGYLYNFRNCSSIISCFKSVIKLIASTKVDIVWTYSGYRENLILALYRLFGGPYLIIKTDSSMPPPQGSLRSRLSSMLFYKFPARMADLLIVESKEVEDYARTHYNVKDLYIYSNGIPLQTFSNYCTAYASQRPPEKPPYILYTGRICREKGVDLLIESFARAADKMPAWNLEIVGPVWDKAYDKTVKKMVSDKKLEDRVTFHPAVFGEKLYRWYHFADIFVLPSRNEGLANRIPEAMFFRNPIVAFDVGQTRSMVNNEVGLIIPPGDVSAFAEAMLQMAGDEKKRKEMGEKANALITADYNDDVLIPSLLVKCHHFLKNN